MNDTQIPESVKNRVCTLIPKDEMKKLVKAGYAGMVPITKVFIANVTYLFTGIDESGYLCGYADLSMGCVEWGPIMHVSELADMKVGLFWLERDRWFSHVEGTNYLEKSSLSGI